MGLLIGVPRETAAGELTIHVVHHGDEGLAGPWAAGLRPGDVHLNSSSPGRSMPRSTTCPNGTRGSARFDPVIPARMFSSTVSVGKIIRPCGTKARPRDTRS